MTQVQTMTKPELNRALMVALGCQVEEHSGTVFFFTILPNGNRLYHQMPDYAGDPAASLEVQAKAIEISADKYVSNLDALVNPEPLQEGWENRDISRLLTASPRERAEAGYITLSSKQ